jgi:hypothetical protein
MRKCAVDGCERVPEPGWARCRSHVEQWLDRLFHTPKYNLASTEELRLIAATDYTADWAPGEIQEAFGK